LTKNANALKIAQVLNLIIALERLGGVSRVVRGGEGPKAKEVDGFANENSVDGLAGVQDSLGNIGWHSNF